jgi:hypothetical protein
VEILFADPGREIDAAFAELVQKRFEAFVVTDLPEGRKRAKRDRSDVYFVRWNSMIRPPDRNSSKLLP